MPDVVHYLLLLILLIFAVLTLVFVSRYRKLKRSDDAMAKAFEISLEGIYCMELQKNQTRASDTYYRLLGYEPGEFQFNLGIWQSMIHPDDQAYVIKAFDQYETKADTFVSIEYRLLKKSGEYMWVLDRSKAVKFDQQGRPECTIGTVTQIDQLKIAQKEVLEKNEQLERMLKELKESQAQVVEMEKMATLGLLTSGIAYELNNPLNYVKGNVHPLKNDFKDIADFITGIRSSEECRGMESVQRLSRKYDMDELLEEVNTLLDGIEQGAGKSSEIIKTLKMFSDDQNAEIPMLLDLHENIDSSIRLLHNKIHHKITIVKKYGAIQQVNGWPGKLHQVFTNILTNSIEAIGDDSFGQIQISTFQDKDQVKIRFEDDGAGVKPGLESQVFEPFFTTKKGNSGLGLSIVSTVMKTHKGNVQLLQGNDKTCFELTIPVSLKID